MHQLVIEKKGLAFSVMVKNIRILLMTYINIIAFLSDTEATKRLAKEMAEKERPRLSRAPTLFAPDSYS